MGERCTTHHACDCVQQRLDTAVALAAAVRRSYDAWSAGEYPNLSAGDTLREIGLTLNGSDDG